MFFLATALYTKGVSPSTSATTTGQEHPEATTSNDNVVGTTIEKSTASTSSQGLETSGYAGVNSDSGAECVPDLTLDHGDTGQPGDSVDEGFSDGSLVAVGDAIQAESLLWVATSTTQLV
ncbi:hypothetical protein V6N12_073708 [Hibiscus sabdariffa]|uniref:Uncharacterized protein n=1 Tax=Hibiscus sabdariffa TaxID=183260 RepID=A0ABR2CT87_9ROSI